MISIKHSDVRYSMANSIWLSDAVRDWCASNYGRGCSVILEAFGIEGAPTVKDAPFIFIYSDGENETAGLIAQATFEVVVVAGVKSKAALGSLDEETIAPRSATDNGLKVRRGVADAEKLLGLALMAVDESACGAVVQSYSVTSEGMVEHPLHWARARVAFMDALTM